jgi:hypothetical protein
MSNSLDSLNRPHHNENLHPIGSDVFLGRPFIDWMRINGETSELFVFYQRFQEVFVHDTFESVFCGGFADLLPWNVQFLTQIVHSDELEVTCGRFRSLSGEI